MPENLESLWVMAKKKPHAGAAYREKGTERVQAIGVVEEKSILTCLRMGGSRADAMKQIGRTGSAADLMLLGQTAKRHAEFKARLEQAEAEGKHHHLKRIHEGDPQWRASAWMLDASGGGSSRAARLKVTRGTRSSCW